MVRLLTALSWFSKQNSVELVPMYKMSRSFGGDEALGFAPENQDSVVNFLWLVFASVFDINYTVKNRKQRNPVFCL